MKFALIRKGSNLRAKETFRLSGLVVCVFLFLDLILKVFPLLKMDICSIILREAKHFKQMLLALAATEIRTKMELWNYNSGQKRPPGECQV